MNTPWPQRLAAGENQAQEFKTSLDYPKVQLLVEEINGGISITFSKLLAASYEAVSYEAVSGGVSNAQDLERLIAQKPGLKTIDLVELNQAPQKTIVRWLKRLKDCQGIEYRGAPKSGGYYPNAP